MPTDCSNHYPRYRRNAAVLGALLCALALIAALPAPAAAAGGSIGAHLGYAKGSDAEDGNGLVGGQLEFRLASFLGIQGAVDYRLVNTYAIDTGPVNGELDVRSVPITASARLYLPTMSNFSLFGVAGAGWYHMIYDYSQQLEDLGIEDNTETTFGWHLGAGAEIMLAPKVSVYGEGRAVFVDPSHSFDEHVQDQIKDFNYDSSYFAAGLNLHF